MRKYLCRDCDSEFEAKRERGIRCPRCTSYLWTMIEDDRPPMLEYEDEQPRKRPSKTNTPLILLIVFGLIAAKLTIIAAIVAIAVMADDADQMNVNQAVPQQGGVVVMNPNPMVNPNFNRNAMQPGFPNPNPVMPPMNNPNRFVRPNPMPGRPMGGLRR